MCETPLSLPVSERGSVVEGDAHSWLLPLLPRRMCRRRLWDTGKNELTSVPSSGTEMEKGERDHVCTGVSAVCTCPQAELMDLLMGLGECSGVCFAIEVTYLIEYVTSHQAVSVMCWSEIRVDGACWWLAIGNIFGLCCWRILGPVQTPRKVVRTAITKPGFLSLSTLFMKCPRSINIGDSSLLICAMDARIKMKPCTWRALQTTHVCICSRARSLSASCICSYTGAMIWKGSKKDCTWLLFLFFD